MPEDVEGPITSGRLAAVFAHPDDDTYGVGGTIALHRERGLELLSVIATSGEAGPIAEDTGVTRENLGTEREAEARAAYEALGFPGVDLRFLGYRDYYLNEEPREEIVERVTEMLREFEPNVVVTFGPDGVTGHHDHITIGEITTEAFHRAREGGGKGFDRLLYVAIPETRVEQYNDLLRESGRPVPEPGALFSLRGVPDDTIAVTVDCSTVWPEVVTAIRAHRTQAGEIPPLDETGMAQVFGTENYVQAWPERQAGSAVLTDVFLGLEPPPGV